MALAAAGLAARAWLSNRFGPVAATVGAIVYMALPYICAYSIYKGAALGQLTASVWMPLALAACDSLRLRFTAVTALGVVLALLVMSNFITMILFIPLMAGYAIACRESSGMSLGTCIASVLLAIVMGFGLAGVYVLPLIAHHRFFDLGAMASNVSGMELSDSFLFTRATSLATRHILVALGGAAIISGVSAFFVIWARSRWAQRVYLLLPLVFGVMAMVPGLGLSLIRVSGLRAPDLDVGDHFPEQMLAINLATLALGVLAYCQVLSEGSRWRDRVLLLGAYVSFYLMLPLSAFLWKAFPGLATSIQFTHRFGGILALAVAGLFAAAIDIGLRRLPSRQRLSFAGIAVSVALAVIIAGIFTWHVNWTWAHGLHRWASYHYDEALDTDGMYRTYVSADRLPAFAKLLGTAASSNRVERTPVVEGNEELAQEWGTVDLINRSPRKVVVSYTAHQTSLMRIPQLYSPLWKYVPLDDDSGSFGITDSSEGLIDVPVVPGRHDFELLFDVGWPEQAGQIMTVASLAVAVGGIVFGLYAKKSDPLAEVLQLGRQKPSEL